MTCVPGKWSAVKHHSMKQAFCPPTQHLIPTAAAASAAALLPQTFDYPSIGAIASFIAETKYPGGLPTVAAPSAVAAAAPAAAPARPLAATGSAAAARAAGSVALTGLSVRFAGISSLQALYRHMRDGTELHTAAPFNRWALLTEGWHDNQVSQHNALPSTGKCA